MALLYIITGKLGLLLALPPGYATIIWPPSGIALGILLMHGRHIWPGVLLGSFLLNSYVSGGYDIQTGWDVSKILAALGIAAGSTLQAVFGRALVERYVGLPLRLGSARELFRLFVLTVPLACTIASSVGVSTLYISGMLPMGQLVDNWAAWWFGDMLGIVVFLPLVLVAPGSRERITWHGATVGALPAVALLSLIVPLGLTFYAWKITSEGAYQESYAEFTSMAIENERALLNRLDSYETALLGGEGFFRGSATVSHAEWHAYADALHLSKNFPGIRGIGWINKVEDEKKESFLHDIRSKGQPDFSIHPKTEGLPLYIITFIEPEKGNERAEGLNIAFEKHRLEAAEKSAESGGAAITKRIFLVQDNQQTPGFLLLHPYYKQGMPLETPEQRRAAITGWIYAPLIAQNFLSGLTNTQGYKLNLRIYDEGRESPETLIYSSADGQARAPKFVVRKTVNVMQQQWLVVWESTPTYEYDEISNNPMVVLVGGLIFTSLFGLFLMVATVRRAETIEWIAEEHRFTLPIVIFLIMGWAAWSLYTTLVRQEFDYIRREIEAEARRVEVMLTTQANEKFLALKRMSQRWAASKGTPQFLWRDDAANYINSMPGLRAIEWIDASLHVRWVEPLAGNEKVVGMNVAFTPERAKILNDALAAEQLMLSPPLDLVQGYKGFVVYLPLMINNKPDGFIAGIFSVDEFFSHGISRDMSEHYTITIGYDGVDYALYSNPLGVADNSWVATRTISLYNAPWQLKIRPTDAFVSSQRTMMPLTVLFGGLLIAALSALTVRYILISRLRSQRLQISNQLNEAIVSGTQLLMLSMDGNGRIRTFNSAAEKALGYKAQEVVGKETPMLWHDAQEVVERAWQLSEELGRRVEPGFEVFTVKALREGSETREWTYRRRDGKQFPVTLTTTTLYDSDGNVDGYLSVAEDITERKRRQVELTAMIDQMRLLVENTPSAVAMFDHQLRYIMTSDRWIKDYHLEGRNVIGQHHYDIFPEIRSMPHWIDIHSRALKGEVFEEHEDSWIRNDGTKEWVKWAIHPWINTDGGIGGIVMFTEVITARKEAEEALKASEETFRMAMEAAPVGQALVSLEGKWLKVNPALCDLLGYTDEELLANDFQSITHPDDLGRDLELVHRIVAGDIKSYQLEKRYYHKTGRIIWAALTVALAHKPDGSPNYFISQIRDITEQREIERIKAEFISTVSHELRTPLTSIRGALGLILGAMSDGVSEKVRGLIEVANNNCERLILLINDILDMDKLGSGEMRYDMKPEALVEITQHAIKDNESYAQRLDVRILMPFPVPADWRVYVDAQRYIQILSNLLSNAAKFSPRGDVVTVHASQHGDMLRVSVSDKGPGIPDEFRGRIFGKFSQADSSAARAKGGTGLGLHITKQMVEHMGGTIGFETTIGKGTTFWVEFPRMKE